MHVASILASKGSDVRTIKPEATVGEAIKRMCSERVGALVVSEDGQRIAGIVSDRGLVCIIAERGVAAMDEHLSEVMTKKVFTCSREDRVSSLMALMTGRRIRHIPIVQDNGTLCGIISIGDVVKYRLDEIQGEADALREYITGAR